MRTSIFADPGELDDFLNDPDVDELSDEEDQGGDDGLEDDEEGRGEKEEEVVKKLVEAALDGDLAFDQDRVQYNIHDLVRMIANGGYKGKVEDQERESLRSMIFGYQVASREKVVRIQIFNPSTSL